MIATSFILAAAMAAPKIDGVIEDTEWKNAAVYDGMKMAGRDEVFPAKVKTFVTADEKNVYVAVKSAVPAPGLLQRVMPARRGALARIDDTVTLAFAGGRVLAVNANGAVSPSCACPHAQPGAPEGRRTTEIISKSTVTNGFWNFECAIPKAAGELVDIGRNWPLADAAYGAKTSLALGRSPVPAADAPHVQVLDVKGGSDAYTVALRLVNPTAKELTIAVAAKGSPEHSQPAILNKKVTVAAGGSEELTLKGAILGDELVKFDVGCKADAASFVRKTEIRPNYAGSPFVRLGNDSELVSYKFAYYPSHNKFRLKTDVSLIPGFAQVVKGVVCRIVDAQGAEVFSKTFHPDAKGVADETFDVPDLRPLTVKSGNSEYKLQVKVEGQDLQGVTYEKKFYRDAMEWEGNKIGLTDVVVPPFTAMKVWGRAREVTSTTEGECSRSARDSRAQNRTGRAREVTSTTGFTVRTVLREHEMSSIGLFRQVKGPAKEGDTEPVKPILAGEGMQLIATVDGKEYVIEGEIEFEDSRSPVKRCFTAHFAEMRPRGEDAHFAEMRPREGDAHFGEMRPREGGASVGGDHRAPRLKGHVDGVFEYDGQLAWTLFLESGKVDALRLDIPFAKGAATHIHACVDNLRHNIGARVPAGTGAVWQSSTQVGRDGLLGDYVPYVWIGGTLRGLSVYGENDRGWVHFDGWPQLGKDKVPVPSQELRRDASGNVTLVFNLVQKPFEISEPRTIKLAFMATPVKPMLENWRSIPQDFLMGAGYCWGAGPRDADVEPFDGTTEFWKKMAEARDTGKWDEAYLEDCLKRAPVNGNKGALGNLRVHWQSGLANCARLRRTQLFNWYTNARGVDFGIPSGRTYCDEWSRYEFMEMDRDFNRFSTRDYTLDPNRAFQDYAAYWYLKMVQSTACDTLYWDDIYLSPNYDLVGTESFRLPDGRIQPGTGVNNMRALVKRCATLQAEGGFLATGNWIHMTDTAIAPISAFAGFHYDMEDFPRDGEAFQHKYPMGYLEAVSIGRQMGCRVGVMAHYPNISKEKSAWYERTGAGMMLCYEFYWKYNSYVFNGVHNNLKQWGYRSKTPTVRVWNYWNDDEPYPLQVKAENVASIAMAKGKVKGEGEGEGEGEAIFVLSDFSGKGGTVRVKVDAAMLGLKPGFKAYDFEKGKKVKVEKAKVKGQGEGTVEVWQIDNTEVTLAGDEVTVEVKPYDFRVIILK